MEAVINTFALPDGVFSCAGRDPKANLFTIQCLQADRLTISTFAFDVGDLFEITRQPRFNRQILELTVGPITMPDYRPGDDNGGFVSFVEDWDDVIEVSIPI